MNQQTIDDINLLLSVARPKIESADKACDSILFSALGYEYGPVAHRVYKTLDSPSKEPGNYYDRSFPAVLLDPWTILTRANSCKLPDEYHTPYNPEFWNHPDMIKTLTDYLALIYTNEVAYGCA